MGVFYPHPPFSLFISTISDVKKSLIHILIHIIPITPFPHLNYFHIYGYSSADFEQSGAGLLSYGQACRARMRVRQDIVLTIPATAQEQAGYFPHLPQAGAGQDTACETAVTPRHGLPEAAGAILYSRLSSDFPRLIFFLSFLRLFFYNGD